MLFLKQKDGRLRWLAIYSNNFRDDDGKPEIITKMSHYANLYLTKEGIVPYPELWHWHIPGTRWGQADYLDIVEMHGIFTIASGLVDVGHEAEAEKLKSLDVLVSHGMPKRFLQFDANDPTFITLHVTREISPLPRHRAANRFTGFYLLKENGEMKVLRDEQKAHLKSLGFDDAAIVRLETELATKDADALAEGRQSKEATVTNAEASANATDANGADANGADANGADANGADANGADVNEGVKKEKGNPVVAQGFDELKSEFVAAITAVMAPMIERMDGVEAKIKEITTAQVEAAAVKEAAIKEATPVFSLAELMLQSVYGDREKAAQIDGRTALAKDAPKEKESTPQGRTGITLVDNLIAANTAK